MNYIYLIIGIFLGYLVASFLSGKKAGQKGIFKSLIIKTKQYKLHLHHWIISLIILIILLIFKYYNNFIYGILIGIFIQGLTYKDFYKIYHNRRAR